jgi:hypothetical protein
MPEHVEVHYRRTPGNQFLVEVRIDGSFLGPPEPVPDGQLWQWVQKALEGHPSAEVQLFRSDAPHIPPYTLGPALLAQLRADPAVVAAAFVVSDVRHVGLRPALIQPTRVWMGAGVLADAFSDDLWCRTRNGRQECPVCSRWHPREADARCALGQQLSMYACGPNWSSTPLRELLALEVDRIWAPRGWNRTPPWISRSALWELFVQWTKEKEEIKCRQSSKL